MRNRAVVSLVVVSLATAAIAAVEIRLGEIEGSISDRSGAALPGVAVTIAGPERRTTVTDPKGQFRFADVKPGTYVASAQLAGFQTTRLEVRVQAGATAQVRMQLEVSSLAETITVVGKGSKVQGAAVLSAAAPLTYERALDLPGRYNSHFNTEAYDHLDENPFLRVSNEPLSTFSIDVDTASYANVRRFLHNGSLPPVGAVRIEEMINYFRFAYPQPTGDTPFSITTELADCPWNRQHRLALIGLQGRDVAAEDVPARNLVFLLDVSGSMDEPDKLPLVQQAMQMLVTVLNARDHVAIVVYAGASGVVLPSTSGNQKEVIKTAIANLTPGGSTNGAAGIRLAYALARQHFLAGGVNRVILATDGDFNVGVTSQDELVQLIERERASGVFLSVLGVGTGNLKDSTMEKLADKGNGNYAYLDSLHEARKVLVHEAGATLVTIAKDVKVQVEFNPAAVAGYRLIGYENRLLRNQDFNDDAKDAGEIGAGHSVTALYEIVPAGETVDTTAIDPLKYQRAAQQSPAAVSDELLTVKLRYKSPDGDSSRLVSTVMHRQTRPMTANIGFASSVAEFGMMLRKSKHVGSGSFASAAARARMYKGDDPDGYRAEFVTLAELAAQLR